MRLTTRGRIVAGIVVVAFLWGSVFGIQAMSAIVIPGVLALGASWLLVGKADRIGIDRRPPEPGFPGDRRTVTMTVRSPEWLTAMVDDELPTGVQALRRNGGRPVKRGQVRYEVVSERRGVETLGPARVVVSDPFGLVAEDFLTDATTTLMTYPTVRPIQSIRNAPDLLPEGGAMRDRHEFDRLREYERGGRTA